MFGKLLKNEFKSTGHAMSWIYFAGAATFAVMVLALLLKIRVLMSISYVVLSVLAILVLAVTVITIIVLFYRSLYGDQGYLSFTLPVTGKQLLGSKIIVTMAWIAISFVFMIASLAFLVAYRIASFSENTRQTIDSIYELLAEFGKVPDKSTMIATGVFVVIALFLLAVFLIVRVAFASSLANTSLGGSTNSIGSAVLFYLGANFINIILYVVGCLIPVYCIFGTGGAPTIVHGLESVPAVSFPVPIFLPIFLIVYHVVLYIVTGNIMTNRINVK